MQKQPSLTPKGLGKESYSASSLGECVRGHVLTVCLDRCVSTCKHVDTYCTIYTRSYCSIYAKLTFQTYRRYCSNENIQEAAGFVCSRVFDFSSLTYRSLFHTFFLLPCLNRVPTFLTMHLNDLSTGKCCIHITTGANVFYYEEYTSVKYQKNTCCTLSYGTLNWEGLLSAAPVFSTCCVILQLLPQVGDMLESPMWWFDLNCIFLERL